MKFNFLYFFFYTFIILFFVSCSNQRLEKIGVIKKKADQFSVSRKAPLEMPPDMYLRPPKLKNEKGNKNQSLDTEELSLDNILNNKKKISDDKIIKSSKEKRILTKILNTKATLLR